MKIQINIMGAAVLFSLLFIPTLCMAYLIRDGINMSDMKDQVYYRSGKGGYNSFSYYRGAYYYGTPRPVYKGYYTVNPCPPRIYCFTSYGVRQCTTY